VLTTPALQILKEFRPDLRVGVVVESRFAPVFEEHPAVDTILAPSIQATTRWRPHLALNFHGGTRSVALTVASGARHRAGFGHYRARWAYNVAIPRAQEILGVERTVHTAEHLASAMFYLGVPQREIPRASLVAPPWPHARPYAALHPFASAPEKTWPADRFAALAQHLRDHDGLDPVILCGPSDDAAPFRDFEIVRASLSDVKAVIRSASLFIGNDSGPAHIASAFGVPLVVLYGPSDPVVWAPWKPTAAQPIVRRPIQDIGVDEVLRALDHLKAPA
jgi:ADP-heptose:LPS heptosyltransferase